jgi:hypothetical protein
MEGYFYVGILEYLRDLIDLFSIKYVVEALPFVFITFLCIFLSIITVL